MKRFLRLCLALLLFPSPALADQIDCKITVDHNGQSIRSTAVAASADTALARAIEKSCRQICTNSPSDCKEKPCDDECLDACIKFSSLSATECFTSENVYVQANRESGRKRLIALRTPNSKKPNTSKDDIHIANWYGNGSGLLAPRPSRDDLLLKPQDAKPQRPAKRKPLLIDNSPKRPLLFFPDKKEAHNGKEKHDIRPIQLKPKKKDASPALLGI